MSGTEKYTNQLYLSKTRPLASTARDGTFCVQLLAYSHPSNTATTPWRIAYFGDAALGFWCHHGADLVPGAVLQVELTQLVIIEGGGRHHCAEMHAHVISLQVLPKAPKSASIYKSTPTRSAPCHQ